VEDFALFLERLLLISEVAKFKLRRGPDMRAKL
jgi:hypothetical protein